MATCEIRRLPGAGTLAHAHAVRRAVFIDEQGVPEAVEMDGNDETATHFVAYHGNRPVGTARLRIPDPDVAKAERVAVLSDHRGNGLGRRLMNRLEDEARERGCTQVRLHAQTTVVDFYRRLGYTVESDEFEQAGIAHVEMETTL